MKWPIYNVRWSTQISYQIYPPGAVIQLSRLAIFTLLLTSSGQEWQFHIATDIKWSTLAISHCYWHQVVKIGNFTLLLTSSGQEWQFHIATDIKWSTLAISHCYWHLVVKNGNFTLLLTSCHQEWWFLIKFHILSKLWCSRMAISHCYWHQVINTGNFTLLLTSSHQEWQFHIATDIKWWRMAIGRCTPRSAGRSTLQMHHGIYIMGCIWQSFWILQEKLGISFVFWIIRFVNIQLALYSHVRCYPPQHPLVLVR